MMVIEVKCSIKAMPVNKIKEAKLFLRALLLG